MSRRYGEEFKRQAVELVIHSGKSQRQVAGELDVSEYSLNLWKKAYLGRQKPAEIDGQTKSPEEMAKIIREQHKEIEYLKRQREILKKARTRQASCLQCFESCGRKPDSQFSGHVWPSANQCQRRLSGPYPDRADSTHHPGRGTMAQGCVARHALATIGNFPRRSPLRVVSRFSRSRVGHRNCLGSRRRCER